MLNLLRDSSRVPRRRPFIYCNPPIARSFLGIFWGLSKADGQQHIRQSCVSVVACSSDSEILEALQTVEDVAIVLTRIIFRCSRVVEPGNDFVTIWIPVRLSNGLSPSCDPLTFFLYFCGHERDWHLIGL